MCAGSKRWARPFGMGTSQSAAAGSTRVGEKRRVCIHYLYSQYNHSKFASPRTDRATQPDCRTATFTVRVHARVSTRLLLIRILVRHIVALLFPEPIQRLRRRVIALFFHVPSQRTSEFGIKRRSTACTQCCKVWRIPGETSSSFGSTKAVCCNGEPAASQYSKPLGRQTGRPNTVVVKGTALGRERETGTHRRLFVGISATGSSATDRSPRPRPGPTARLADRRPRTSDRERTEIAVSREERRGGVSVFFERV